MERPLTALTSAMTEEQLLTAITEAATFLGWRWVHYRRSDKAQMMGHSGSPDLVLARDGLVLFLELKSEKGVVSPDQAAWVHAINGPYVPGRTRTADARVVRPSDLDAILEVLR